ncbi:MAG: clan AA aspartic protease [Planctomycetes bacterium]|nr:clan AA aspartic protease [Planctomycetota bacterium]
MGATQVTACLRAGPKARRTYEALFLVDTGATDCMAPARELRRIGVAPRGRRTYELANGATVEYEVGFVEVEFLGDTVPARVIFGPDGSSPILGVTALELSGVTVDPVTQTLKRLPALLLK